MAPRPQYPVQPTRRSFSVPSWVWSLVLLAVTALALTMYHNVQGAQAAAADPNEKAIQAAVNSRSAQPANRAVDPAVRSVLDFVAIHGLQYASEAPQVVLDADALSYTDYLRRHGALPYEPSWSTPMNPHVQALINQFSLRPLEANPPSDSLLNR